MKRIAIGNNGHRIKSGALDVWSTVPWLTTHRIGAHHGYRIDGAEHHLSAEETKQQAALNAWEDEGGKTSASTKTIGR
jgi:hypothetical protein